MSNSTTDYDLIVIGAGPAGYVAAIRAAQLGLKTACIDSTFNPCGQSSLGGTYINAGCVSAMALLESAKLYHALQHDAAKHGIKAENVGIDLQKMLARKNQIIATLSGQIGTMFSHHKVSFFHAYGRLLNAHQVELKLISDNSLSVFNAKNIVLATGSVPAELGCAPVDNELILDSTAALNLEVLPKRLGIIGAGIIGLELAGIWSRLGCEVILFDAQEKFLSMADFQIARHAHHIYTKQGLELHLGARVTATKKEANQVIVTYQDHDGYHTINLDKLIVASGRRPNSSNIAAAEADLLLDDNGFVHVDQHCVTNLPSVYAIGDLNLLGPMLAHKGLEEGIFVAEHIANKHGPINYNVIPSVVYTEPEIAWVGQTEQALKAVGEHYKVGVFPLKATSRGQAMDKTSGMIKILSHAETDVILGVHIISTLASELIAEAVLAMEFSACTEDLARTIHAHPSISEAFYEAALALEHRSLHIP